MTTIASSGTSVSSATSELLTTGTVENLTLPVANTEVSHVFPAQTKAFMLKPRGSAMLKVSQQAGQSGTVYWTIAPGAIAAWSNIGSASTTIYVQSDTAGAEVELWSWV